MSNKRQNMELPTLPPLSPLPGVSTRKRTNVTNLPPLPPLTRSPGIKLPTLTAKNADLPPLKGITNTTKLPQLPPVVAELPAIAAGGSAKKQSLYNIPIPLSYLIISISHADYMDFEALTEKSSQFNITPLFMVTDDKVIPINDGSTEVLNIVDTNYPDVICFKVHTFGNLFDIQDILRELEYNDGTETYKMDLIEPGKISVLVVLKN